MADYKRFVSYMYEYEDGVKKKNVGYTRVETRNGECRFTIHMQLEGLAEGIFPTYLIHRPTDEMDLVYIGDCVVKNQVMDSRLNAKENNIMDSEYQFSEMGGVLLFLNSGVFYATEWDDKLVLLEEVLDALKPKSKPKQIVTDPSDLGKQIVTDSSDLGKQKEAVPTFKADKLPSHLTSFDEANRPVYMLPGGWKMKEAAMPTRPTTPINPWKLVEKYKAVTPKDIARKDMTSKDDISKDGLSKDTEIYERPLESAMEDILEGEKIKAARNMNGLEKAPWKEKKFIREVAHKENPSAEKIFADNPRIYPFEDNEITRCVKLEPKDIGTLPSDTWILSNNSFLLHGYYCYHHLIFAEIVDRYGCHYILGVPGIYHNRERFMARMFGFECFKSIRKRELKQGDFGYWYYEINF